MITSPCGSFSFGRIFKVKNSRQGVLENKTKKRKMEKQIIVSDEYTL